MRIKEVIEAFFVLVWISVTEGRVAMASYYTLVADLCDQYLG
jgi:hypothetical protein